MKKEIIRKKIRVDKMLEEERKALSPQELKLIKQLTRSDPKERFRKVLV